MTNDSTISALLIEDNPGDVRLIREMLTDVPNVTFTLDVASLLAQGLELAHEKEYDVILLDLSLPDSVGVDTLVRAHRELPMEAIVVLTGFNDQELGIYAVKEGAQDYLTKDELDSKLLGRAIRYAIERQRSEKALRQSQEEYRSLIDDVFDTSAVAVLILDADYKVVWVNKATENYFGLKREDLLGDDARVAVDTKIKCVFENPDEFAKQILAAYLSQAFSERFECHVLPDGDNSPREDRWLEHWSQPIRSGIFKGGRIEQYLDITRRKRSEIAEHEQYVMTSALRDTAGVLTSTLNLSEVLDRILTNLELVVPYDAVNILLMDDDEQVRLVRRRAFGNWDTDKTEFPEKFPLASAQILSHMAQTGQPQILSDLYERTDSNAEALYARFQLTEFRSFAGVPIRVQNVTNGFICVFSFRPGFFMDTDGDRLSAFAAQAAIALQNARLFEQSQELATVEERQRIARELHDSVSQTLFTSSTMAEAALRQWDINLERARELLRDVHDLTKSALAEMRVLLLELRPASLAQVDLDALLEQFCLSIRGRRQFNVALEIDALPTLPADVKVALYRITQEALNNIIKHAHATQVLVRIRNDGHQLALLVSDDGSGFKISELSPASLGLGIMRERAEQIGALIEIVSKPHDGTKIEVTWKYGD